MPGRMQDMNRYRHKVSVETNTPSNDGQGGFTDSWAEATTAWCSIRHAGGSEQAQRGMLDSQANIIMETRYQSAITPAARINYDSRIFHIERVDNHGERDRYMTIYCREEQA